MQRKFSGAKVSTWLYGELALHCGALAEWANRQSNPYRIVPGPHGSAERKRRKTFSFLSVGLPSRSSLRSCSELRRCPPSLKLWRDSPALVGDANEDWR